MFILFTAKETSISLKRIRFTLAKKSPLIKISQLAKKGPLRLKERLIEKFLIIKKAKKENDKMSLLEKNCPVRKEKRYKKKLVFEKESSREIN